MGERQFSDVENPKPEGTVGTQSASHAASGRHLLRRLHCLRRARPKLNADGERMKCAKANCSLEALPRSNFCSQHQPADSTSLVRRDHGWLSNPSIYGAKKKKG